MKHSEGSSLAAPNLTIAVEPTESSSVVYGQLAAKSSEDAPEGQLSLVVAITNNEATDVHLNEVTVSFEPSVAVSSSTIAADLTIASTKTAYWWFNSTDNIILPMPAPTALKLSLACNNFTAPAVANFLLAPYASPATDGGYLFPAKTEDLEQTEFWFGVSAKHDPGGLGIGTFAAGTQSFAYDMGVRGFDYVSQKWTEARSGTTKSQNQDVRTWGKRIYAMAAGSVVQFKNDMPENTTFGLQKPTPNPVEGNHFYIQHGPDLALYAHFQKGSLNSDLLSVGAVVSEGQFLGLAGNSGNSTEPHLHMHIIRATTPWGGPPRPLPFRNVHVLDGARLMPHPWPPNSDEPWTKVAGECLPSVTSAIWPGPIAIGRRRLFMVIAWAWLIFIGGLMITQGGIDCIACGPVGTRILGVVSIGLGILGFVVSRLGARGKAAAGIEIGNMHG
jgi:murein DD-endopeptidase MepM/ murein hydrolase activator NlpD